MSEPDATITARLTSPTHAALATIGVLGPGALAIAQRLFRRRVDWNDTPLDQPLYGDFGDRIVDDVVLHLVARAPIPEFVVHCHGGPAMVRSLLVDIEKQGAHLVDWRAYLAHQGKSAIQIEAAEAMSRTISWRSTAILLDQSRGLLDEAFRGIEENPTRDAIDALTRWAPLGRHLVDPWRVVLFGQPNVGKSSLLNALAGFDRAIVTVIEGTTRDLLHATIALDGWSVELIDGAGLRDDAGEIEREGQRRLTALLDEADLAIQVVDLSKPVDPNDVVLADRHQPPLLIGNKVDLTTESEHRSAFATSWSRGETRLIPCSAVTGEGLAQLTPAIVASLIPEIPPPHTPVPFTMRQLDWLAAQRARIT
ncbi:tRNA modification GTPase MnmE [Planctomycetes bacterium Pan216]|uniref:tRNA modification GTPase MnmE n=1 Tax=Kolteria novifilia TaxID=2527975 RepID=A0A518B849_9BACT|nr:tRNA modification GTPase MnmE [Planctomycetes bacterium Pan216]